MSLKSFEKKYPKSKSGQQCIGPCYKPGTWIIHPVTLDYITNEDFPFCPTNYYPDPDNPDTLKRLDECFHPIEKPDKTDKTDIEMNIILPKFGFNCGHFLKIYYKIYSFEQTLEWLKENKYAPQYTKLRLLECSWQSYGNDVNILTDELVEFYVNMIKKSWIKKIYKHIEKYVKIDGDKIYFSVPPKSEDKSKISNEYNVEKINFIIKKIVNKNNIYKFFTKYIKGNKKRWDEIEDHNIKMQKFLVKYIVNKIKESI